jgi:hypothetical protein
MGNQIIRKVGLAQSNLLVFIAKLADRQTVIFRLAGAANRPSAPQLSGEFALASRYQPLDSKR